MKLNKKNSFFTEILNFMLDWELSMVVTKLKSVIRLKQN